MTIMIVGACGSLGTELIRVLPKAAAFSHKELDITDRKAVLDKISELKPSVVINAAAYTNVEGAETEKDAAFAINHAALESLVEACNKNKARLIHFSTDTVFDGSKKDGYKEDDKPNPVNVYGKSKAAGEEVVRKCDDYMLIRTSWLYGKNKSFPMKIIQRAKKDGVVRVVNDQFGSPTSAADLADRIPEIMNSAKGIYHLTNSGVCSWFDFAREIIRLSGIKVDVVPISTAEYPSKTVRPKYGVLVNTKLKPLRPWKDAIVDYMKANKKDICHG